jgi:hypothetical protein
MGLSGVLYAAIVARRLRRQTAYKPEFEDWLFHVFLSFAGYITLSACALAARSHSAEALYGVSAAALLLLFIGIHNAWMPSPTTSSFRDEITGSRAPAMSRPTVTAVSPLAGLAGLVPISALLCTLLRDRQTKIRAARLAELVHQPGTMAYSGSIGRNKERLLSRRR